MHPQQLKKIERIVNVIDRGEAALLQYINELETKVQTLTSDTENVTSDLQAILQSEIEATNYTIEQLREEVSLAVSSIRDDIANTEKPKNGETPTDEKLLSLITPLIPKVKNGNTPSRNELIALIRPLIPEPLKGEPGVSPDHTVVALEASKLAYNELIKAVPTIDQIEDMLTEKGITNYSDEIKTLQNRTQMLVQIASQRTNTSASSSTPGVGGVETPSGTVDGSNTVFTVSNTPAYINVDGINKYLTVHYTYSAPTITITDGNPPVLFIRSHY